MVGKAVN